MAYYKTTPIIPVALALVAAAVAIAALVSLARVVFFSGSTTTTTADVAKETLLSTNADRAVLMRVRGNIVADEKFHSYQIKITPNERKLTTYEGYMDKQTDSISLRNNIPAYEQFVYALYKAGQIKGTELTGEKNDLRGVCAVGYVYEFLVLKDGKTIKQLWTSSCSGAPGSLKAELDRLTNLYTVQIPDANKLIGKLW